MSNVIFTDTVLKAVSSSKNRGRPRRCRAFRRRTVDFVRRSVASWQAIFQDSAELPLFEEAASCSDMARLVKSFLGTEFGSSPESQLSFQSIKKGLPDSCQCMTSGMIDKLASSISGTPRTLPDGYLAFVKRETRRLFPKLWDSSYEGFCLTSSPPLSACSEESRAHGGTLASLVNSERIDGKFLRGQEWFLNHVLHGNGDLPRNLRGELMVVQSAGKPRPLSKFESQSFFLRPLHKTIYNRLRSFRWLLVGPPTEDRLRKAGFQEGLGDLVSGDYASATDGLSIEVAETILETIFSTSGTVPANVKAFAKAALRPLLTVDEKGTVVEVSVGQMMGSFLSFPLLCLQNYLAFKWATRRCEREIPLLINGDDILYQATGVFEHWVTVLGSVGLTVERTKTSVEESWGTINSTLLRWSHGFLRPAWSARFGMFRPAEFPNSLGKSFLDFLSGCDDPELRYRAGREWFKWHVAELRSASVSLPSLGFRGLLARRLAKSFDVGHFPDRELPTPFKKHDVGFSSDFTEVTLLSAVSQEELFQSSCEVSARKWNQGYQSVSVVKEAIRYCLARSYPHPHDYSFNSGFFGSSDKEFAFRLKNLIPYRKKQTKKKAYLAPFPPRVDVLFVSTVLGGLSPFDGEFETLPAYSEFADAVVGGGTPWW